MNSAEYECADACGYVAAAGSGDHIDHDRVRPRECGRCGGEVVPIGGSR